MASEAIDTDAANNATTQASAPARTQYQKSEHRRVHRSLLKSAPYNPRVLSHDARKRLKKNLQTRGLMGGIVWNEQTGNLVSGHQRLSVLDSLEGKQDYHLDVEVVNLNPKAEKEQNLFLNNHNAQGDWDMDRLGEVLHMDISVEDAGFDLADVYRIFGDSALEAQSDRLETLSEQMKKAKETYKEVKLETSKREDCQYYLVVIFASQTRRAAWLEKLAVADTRFLDGAILEDLLEGDEEEDEAEVEGEAVEDAPENE